MNEGDITLTPLSQADGRVKNRPVLLLRQMPPFGDWLVCGVSTQLRQQVVDFDELVHDQDSDFAVSGLKTSSLNPAVQRVHEIHKMHEIKKFHSILNPSTFHPPGEASNRSNFLKFRAFRVFRGPNCFF